LQIEQNGKRVPHSSHLYNLGR